jgi:hypothetical protein
MVQPELKNVQTFNNFDPLELLLMDESFAKGNDRSSSEFPTPRFLQFGNSCGRTPAVK